MKEVALPSDRVIVRKHVKEKLVADGEESNGPWLWFPDPV